MNFASSVSSTTYVPSSLSSPTLPPPIFPKPIEAGGEGNCAILSLLHQACQMKNINWKHLTKDDFQIQVQVVRQVCALYMQMNSRTLAQDHDFWNDVHNDWDTLFKEDIKLLLKVLTRTKVEAFAKTFSRFMLDETKQTLIATADNWRYNIPLDANQALEAKTLLIEVIAECIKRNHTQLDSSFWNIYTKVANDSIFLKTHFPNLEVPIKQILIVTRIGDIYRSVGFWPKELGENKMNISDCGFIYYNGSSHYKSFDRNQIADYLTSLSPPRFHG